MPKKSQDPYLKKQFQIAAKAYTQAQQTNEMEKKIDPKRFEHFKQEFAKRIEDYKTTYETLKDALETGKTQRDIAKKMAKHSKAAGRRSRKFERAMQQYDYSNE